jgi:hypothetical protein
MSILSYNGSAIIGAQRPARRRARRSCALLRCAAHVLSRCTRASAGVSRAAWHAPAATPLALAHHGQARRAVSGALLRPPGRLARCACARAPWSDAVP